MSGAKVRAALAPIAALPDDDAAELRLDSLAMLQAIEAIEIAFDVRVRSADRAAFKSVATLAAFVERAGAR